MDSTALYSSITLSTSSWVAAREGTCRSLVTQMSPMYTGILLPSSSRTGLPFSSVSYSISMDCRTTLSKSALLMGKFPKYRPFSTWGRSVCRMKDQAPSLSAQLEVIARPR